MLDIPVKPLPEHYDPQEDGRQLMRSLKDCREIQYANQATLFDKRNIGQSKRKKEYPGRGTPFECLQFCSQPWTQESVSPSLRREEP